MNTYQLRQGASLELFHDLRAMYFNGALADAELAGDDLVGQPFSHQQKHLALTFG